MSAGNADRLPFWRSPAARVAVGVVVGAVVTAILWPRTGSLALLGGWTGVAGVFTGWTWLALWHFDARRTASHAGREQPGHAAVVSLILGGALSSLVGVGVLLNRAHDDPARWMAVGSIVLSWLTIHTLFALIYAKHYFASGRGGGIDFNDPNRKDQPSYSDFFYIAFAVGMSFAISDTNLTSTRMRRTALGHALLSFVFGTMIIASVVNVLSSG
ncbi:DUF1345 domain-containing protein [Mycobacterium sp. NBC_00419]|uniref:DUF1345 domain-containing protein n=1 Tax=Mycobacterium sp. NBC_00419 TaxID=2975989 RepID=UPI002E1FE79E